MWIDVWEGGCPTGTADPAGLNPCMPAYHRFRNATLKPAGGAGAVEGFSQQPTLANSSAQPHYTYNGWTVDGTPVFLPPAALWYPDQKGYCNGTDGGHGVRPSPASLAGLIDCIEAHLKEVAKQNPARPLFVPAYGVPWYLDVALAMAKRLPPADFAIVGVQDFAVLGRAAAQR